MPMNRVEASFLALLILGVLLLLVGLFRTRQHWREDRPPFSRGTRSLDVFVRPDRYATPGVVGGIRRLNRIGMLILLAAMGMLVVEWLRR